MLREKRDRARVCKLRTSFITAVAHFSGKAMI
jgi:hypothetical protein